MRYEIILDVKEDHPCFNAFRAFCTPLVIQGQTVLSLSASSVRFDAHYVHATLLLPEDLKGLEMAVPHRFVMLAYGQEGDHKVGFSTDA